MKIVDHEGKVIHDAPDDCYVLYRQGETRIAAAKIKELEDPDLLRALANAVKLGS